MKPMMCLVALAALPAAAELRSVPPQVPVTLYTHYAHTAPEAVISAVKSEVAEIMDPVGIVFDWRSLESATGSDISVELVVVNFKGICDARPNPSMHPVAGALGWTHTSNGEILPFADIDCDRISGLLRFPLAAGETAARHRLFGRAIGRVLAHELYHVFAKTSHHAATGVAKAAYTASELTADEFHFEESEYKVLRRSKTREILAHPDGVSGQ
jgi:hypothetical protein